MTQPSLAQPFNGLHEMLALQIANQRVIQHPRLLNTTLADLYDRLSQSDTIHSYTGFSPLTHIGFTELHGRREAQEDRIVYGTVPTTHPLTDDRWQAALTQTVGALETLIDAHHSRRAGSTLCFTVINNHHLYTASVGDSTAYLVVLDAEGRTLRFERLNKRLHHPTEPSEKARLEQSGQAAFIRHERLMGLALSRAMGDIDLEPYGLIHEPDVYHHVVELPAHAKAWLIVACDGLTEGGCLQENAKAGYLSIEALMQTHAQNNPQDIAQALAIAAIDEGSSDNISVLVTEIDPTFPVPRYLGVCDGHGGDQCADLLRQHFHEAFVRKVEAAIVSPSPPVFFTGGEGGERG